MKDQFQRILDIYSNEKTETTDKERESYKLIVEQLPNTIRQIISNSQYNVKGSVGQGRKTKIPWISIIHNSIASTSEGIYLVYIFKSDMSGFYLSLMQGYKYLDKHLKGKYKRRNKDSIMRKISEHFKKMISNESLTKEKIELDKPEQKLTNVISKWYPSNEFTSEQLKMDLKTFISEYQTLLTKFEGKSYGKLIETIIENINVDQELFEYIKINGARDPMNEPTKHDGSYELTDKVLEFYKTLNDYEWKDVSANDLFLLLSCSLIRKDSNEKNINKYLKSSLLSSKSDELNKIINRIWENAKNKKYTNTLDQLDDKGIIKVGLFSINHQISRIKQDEKTLNPKIREFIKMCIELKDINDENMAINRVQSFIDTYGNISNFVGKATQILHCVNPMFFPILNTPGINIYSKLGVNLPSTDKFKNYAKCCKITKSYRDANFPEFKNYRVIDFYGWKYSNENKKTESNDIKGSENFMTEKLGKNTILFGPPGTGKTYNSKIYAVAICNGKSIEEIKAMDYEKEVLSRYNELVAEGRIAFTTFHQSYGYEEFIEGIQPLLDDKSGEKKVYYDIISGVFKKFCENSRINHGVKTSTKEEKSKPCVFIIDEINRGNISKIFGELITLIEESKREGAAEAMSCILPYSKEKFSVPNNVYILGTMNTADRSIAIMDTALRRRFDFIEMPSEKNILEGLVIDDLNIPSLLESINQRIELLYDREHTIGHAYFIPLLNNKSIGMLKQIFRNRILPLLQEYFYEDYNKIRLVFGNNAFINEENIIPIQYFKDGIPDGMLQEKRYTINDLAFDKIENYKEILLKKG